jgi:hypothetical protein
VSLVVSVPRRDKFLPAADRLLWNGMQTSFH